VNKRTKVAPHKVREEVSNKETRNHFEPCDVQVSLPRRADESSEGRSSGDKVLTCASRDAEGDEGRAARLPARAESTSNLVQATWPKRLPGHHPKGTWAGSSQPAGGDDLPHAHRGTDDNRTGSHASASTTGSALCSPRLWEPHRQEGRRSRGEQMTAKAHAARSPGGEGRTRGNPRPARVQTAVWS
jgi:hypothetical protein